MSNKLWRVVRACVELGANNPIQQIHDQGAGGNCNVVKEIIYPLGAEIDIRAIKLGDETMSVLEIWGAEYQENDALLIKPEDRGLLEEVCRRERCNMQVCTFMAAASCNAHPLQYATRCIALRSKLHNIQALCYHTAVCCTMRVSPNCTAGRWMHSTDHVVHVQGVLQMFTDFVDAVTQVIGTIDGSGKIVLKDKNQAPEDPVPVDLDLEKVLGDMPRKTYNFKRSQPQLATHQLPHGGQLF